jgi:hypothetical protein
MAKVPPQKTAEPARFRLIVMEAEIPAGSDLTQIVHAVQNAIRPAVTTFSARPPRALNAPAHNGTLSETLEPEGEEPPLDQADDVEVVQETARSPRPTRRTTPKVPDVMNDLDLTSAVPLKDYATQKNPQTQNDRFLVVIAWFKQYRGITAVTAGHVYTCYRHMSWPCVILPDFAQPLRNLKSKQIIDGDRQTGYSLGLLGQGRVDKMGGE